MRAETRNRERGRGQRGQRRRQHSERQAPRDRDAISRRPSISTCVSKYVCSEEDVACERPGGAGQSDGAGAKQRATRSHSGRTSDFRSRHKLPAKGAPNISESKICHVQCFATVRKSATTSCSETPQSGLLPNARRTPANSKSATFDASRCQQTIVRKKATTWCSEIPLIGISGVSSCLRLSTAVLEGE